MKKFIIHTNSYAGNFEREICAFITGHIGECGVGSKMVEDDINVLFTPYICQVMDDHECKRPVAIFPNPRYANNGLGHNFDKSKLDECIIAQQKHADYIKNVKLKRLYDTLDFYQGTKHDVTRLEAEIVSVEKEISDYLSLPPMEIPTYNAYNSVCIYVTDNIPENLVELMKERAYEYAENHKIIIENFELLVDEISNDIDVISDNDTIKVKVLAHKNHILIETLNPDEYDKDFTPCGNGRIGCSLSNNHRLGISEEAFELLSQIERGHDAIGDIMWDKNSFGWIGGLYAIKDLKSVGDRSFRIQHTYQTIPNEVSLEQINAIEKILQPKIVDYSDILFHPWLEFKRRGDDTYDISMSFHSAHCCDVDEFTNIPEGCLSNSGDSFDIRISDEYRQKICEKIYKIFNKEYNEPVWNDLDERLQKLLDREDFSKHRVNININSNELMDYLNRFFEIGFFNNIMHPRKDYWRLSYDATLEDYLKKLNEF